MKALHAFRADVSDRFMDPEALEGKGAAFRLRFGSSRQSSCATRRSHDMLASTPRPSALAMRFGMRKIPVRSTALAHIPVGVLVERRKAKSPWLDLLWRPVSVLPGTPSAAPWTPIGSQEDRAVLYAGACVIELHRSETANYRDNLASQAPALWVVLRPVASEPGYEVLTVTADPAEGEAFTDAGNDLVETVPMPAEIIETIGNFIVKHHVERPFVKRRRADAKPAAGGRRRDDDEGGE